jgi:mannose-6-phosphate isomerase-like protein (cupin superfamily)
MQNQSENKEIRLSKDSAQVASPTGGSRMGAAVSKHQPLKHYLWGSDCDGWNLVDEEALSVKQELMPAGTKEVKHYHEKAQQFFFILKGTASFEIEDSTIEINAGEGLHIKAGIRHRIANEDSEDLEFLLSSQPSTKDDRVNCE